MTLLEIGGNAFTLATVYLAHRNSVHTWWTGMVAVTLYGVLFYQAHLYADTLLQVFFFGTCVLGWWQWQRGGTGGTELPLSTLTIRGRLAALASVAAASVLAGFVFSTYTSAALPYADSFILGGSVVAQLLMMRRKIDHWPLWMAVDAVAVVVYSVKSLYLTAAVYAVLLGLCVRGLHTWLRLHARQPPPSPSLP